MSAESELAEQQWLKESALKRAKELTAELDTGREKAERYRLASLKLDAELIAERQKVRALTAILESICEEWGRNYNSNPICAGQRMETLGSNALEKLEDAQ